LAEERNLTAKSKGSYGKNTCVHISLPVSIVEEVEKRRRFDSRSRYILRAVDRYLREEEERESKGVKGDAAVHQTSFPPTTPTPSTQVTRTANTVLEVQPATSRRSGL
jgi:hypothetical protein